MTHRLVGVDAARCVALVGMMATHLVLARGPDGELTAAHAIASGRASALFALLAGVSLALMTGGRRPVAGRERAARSAGLVVRALLVGLVGLLLGQLGSGLAVILTYYAVMFVLALPFLGLGAPALAALAAVVGLAGPVLSRAIRPALPPRGYDSPWLAQLADPGQLLAELLVTGYYPALPWLAYLLAGLAVGRCDLGALRTVGVLVVTGLGLAVAAEALSAALVGPGVLAGLVADPAASGVPGAGADSVPALRDALAEGLYGTTPTGGSWDWLLIAAPHTGTPFDLARTTGSALVVLGLLLLLDRLPATGREAAGILTGAGAATLTFYSVHVVMRTPQVWPPEGGGAFATQVLVILLAGAVLGAAGRRGPLEALVGAASRVTADAVRGPQPDASGPDASSRGSSG